MNDVCLAGETVSLGFRRQGRRWLGRFARQGTDTGVIDLSRDMYGWIRADGFAPGSTRRIRIEKTGTRCVAVKAETTDKNGCVWDMASRWELVRAGGVEINDRGDVRLRLRIEATGERRLLWPSH